MLVGSNIKHLDHGTRRTANIFQKPIFNRLTVWLWTALIGAALITFGGTEYHQLGIGILLSSVTLLILLSLEELVWQALRAVHGTGLYVVIIFLVILLLLGRI